jgi:hypothetical protein
LSTFVLSSPFDPWFDSVGKLKREKRQGKKKGQRTKETTRRDQYSKQTKIRTISESRSHKIADKSSDKEWEKCFRGLARRFSWYQSAESQIPWIKNKSAELLVCVIYSCIWIHRNEQCWRKAITIVIPADETTQPEKVSQFHVHSRNQRLHSPDLWEIIYHKVVNDHFESDLGKEKMHIRVSIQKHNRFKSFAFIDHLKKPKCPSLWNSFLRWTLPC